MLNTKRAGRVPGKRGGSFRLRTRRYWWACGILISLMPFSACRPSDAWEILDSQNPPTFKIKGNGDVKWVWVFGPYSPEAETKEGEVKLLWKIAPDVYQPMSEMTSLTFGQVPHDWRQEFPEKSPPDYFIEGKWYVIGAVSSLNRSITLCVLVKNGQIIRYSTPEGCS